MSSFRYLLCFFILISFTNAISLDIPCTNVTQCGGPGTKCEGGKCQCDTPWYTPCNTAVCTVRVAFVYEGSPCRAPENCLDNAVCENNRCKCKPDFTALNGLCYKSLNTTCSNANECWSRDCPAPDNVCKCPFGSESRGDNLRCKRRLAKLSANWTIANASGEFCYSDGVNHGCQDIHATCRAVAPNRESFCQCDLPFEANYEKQECELKQYPGALSPSKTELPSVNCGRCQDPNALCASVNQTTCWCRSGFSKAGDNKCEKSLRVVLFPHSTDISNHDYNAPNCSLNGNTSSVVALNGLCVCASGYKYGDKNTACQPIEPKWEDDFFEYGVCTRIDSQGMPQNEDGLCPPPLTCQLRRDKHVCSCGLNQYLATDSNCYLFLERTLPAPISGNCPPHANVNGTQCLCAPYDLYKTSDDKRQCELRLSPAESGSCQAGEPVFNTTCANTYGEHTRFCSRGECQCIPGVSFYSNENGRERCVTLLDVNTANSNDCPVNAERNGGGVCKCKVGYRAAVNSNRLCERKVNQLYDSSNMPQQSGFGDVDTNDCRALYPDYPVEARNNACVCVDGSYLLDSKCTFFLETTLTNPSYSAYCPSNSDAPAQSCVCTAGYKNDGYNRTCVALTGTVYAYNTTGVENITGINDNGCRALFGNAAKASQTNGHCECLETNLAFWSNNRCFFLIEVTQAVPTPISTCPPNSEAHERICKCPPGYNVTAEKLGCSRKNIYSQNLQAIDPAAYANCDAGNVDSDCEGLHGEGAVCRNNTCYCDRRKSFVHNQRCQLFSKYVFPGIHERASVTCNSQEDCGVDADRNNIECGFANDNRYKVCKCKAGYLLNPADSTCVINRCPTQCQENAECRGYTCECKAEYYKTPSGQCVRREPPLVLHEKCNTTVWNTLSTDAELVCSQTCTRAECNSDYRDDGPRCLKQTFDDSCQHMPSLCNRFGGRASCDRDENKCACLPGHYRSDSKTICARAVNGACFNHEECGDFGECLSNLCRCKPGQKEQQVTDSVGRSITRCINGVGQLRFSPVFFLFFILARIIFA